MTNDGATILEKMDVNHQAMGEGLCMCSNRQVHWNLLPGVFGRSCISIVLTQFVI